MLVSFESYSGPSGIPYIPVQYDNNIADSPGFDICNWNCYLISQMVFRGLILKQFVVN